MAVAKQDREQYKMLSQCRKLASDLHLQPQQPGEPPETFMQRILTAKDAMVDRSLQWYLNSAPREGESKESYVKRGY